MYATADGRLGGAVPTLAPPKDSPRRPRDIDERVSSLKAPFVGPRGLMITAIAACVHDHDSTKLPCASLKNINIPAPDKDRIVTPCTCE